MPKVFPHSCPKCKGCLAEEPELGGKYSLVCINCGFIMWEGTVLSLEEAQQELARPRILSQGVYLS